MLSAYRSTELIQPGQSSLLLYSNESPTATNDQGASPGGEAVGCGLGVAVFAGNTVGGIAVAGIGVTAGAQALKTTASNSTNTIVFIAVPLTDEELTR
jgi:hypothetical protein